MTVAELIKALEQAKPYLEVRMWDTQRQVFTDRFYLQSATYDDELLLTPADDKQREASSSPGHLPFDPTEPSGPSAAL